jgi:predicted permease
MMIRYAMRSLRRSPIFSIMAVLSLGLALALNTTLVALADAIVHPYVPYNEPEHVLTAFLIGGDRHSRATPEASERAIRDELYTAQAVASYTLVSTMVSAGGKAEDQYVAAVSPNLFDVLAVHPLAGRSFGPADALGSAATGAVISFRLWNRFFPGQRFAQGQAITVGSATFTVIGVMPPGVHFPLVSDVWLPLASVSADTMVRKIGPFVTFRLKRGATLNAARGDLGRAVTRLAKEYGQESPYSAQLVPLTQRGEAFRSYVYFLASGAVVLLIACANLGSLMLARGTARRREIAIRVALGASRRTIVAGVLTECSLVVALGTGLGILLMTWALQIVPYAVAPYVPALGDVQPTPSWRVFGFVALAAITTLVVAGLLPAFRAAAVDPAEPIKQGGATTGRVRDRYNSLVAIEVALSTGLLMTAGLFALYSTRLASFEFRYYADRLVVAHVRVTADRVPDGASVERFYDELLSRSRHASGAAEAATRYFETPDQGIVSGEQGESGNHWTNVSKSAIVSPEYLRTVGIPIVDGRDFEPGDRQTAGGVVIVDQRAARLLWPNSDSPVGRMLKLGPDRSQRPWLRVIGVAKATELQPRADPDLPPEPQVYVLEGHDAARERDLIVRGDQRGSKPTRAALVISVRREIQGTAPWLGMPRVRPWLEEFESKREFTAFLASTFAAFGAFGLVLCAVGLYGTVAYSVSKRQREFALRAALGARPIKVVAIVLHDTTITVLAGIGLGGIFALVTTRRLSETLSVQHYELVIALVVAEVTLFVVGALACLGPMLQAVRADPVEVLRTG